ncbi:RNAse P Rpr2/Rpp21/SNM1 subunit domain-containing protein [Tricladium varicosporioides]|nr:RNAse P Rpr2/Rpp21/SNM1 subunit domain-containing protein [Hymenoscyphus varicosporioides]
MAKAKSASVQNKMLYSRISYLFQAASYLAAQQQSCNRNVVDGQSNNGRIPTDSNTPSEIFSGSAATRLASDVRTVSQKAQIRMSPVMKQSICRNCTTMLVEGSTCMSRVENCSKGGKKPWADFFVRRCNTCGFEKRYPVGAQRQKRRPQRALPALPRATGDPKG